MLWVLEEFAEGIDCPSSMNLRAAYDRQLITFLRLC